MPPRPGSAQSRRLACLAIVLVALGALAVPLPAAWIERWYSHGFYLHLQRVVTPASSLLPFALLDLAAAVALVWWLVHAVRVLRCKRALPALGQLAAGLAVFAAVIYLWFLAMWGLNYQRVSLEHKLEFDASRITREAARGLAVEAIRQVNQEGSGARGGAMDRAALAASFAEAQRLLGARLLAEPAPPKHSLLGLYFRWAAIDGMTDPFFLEIIVNPDVLPAERPFVVAHEWAHLAGYADESEANFVAWLTCARGDEAARYSGWLALYGHLSNALPRDDRRQLAAMLGPGPRRDLLAISARLLRSAPVVRHVARDVYDSYLKANRVERGILSYDAVVRLVLGVGFDEGWIPRGRARNALGGPVLDLQTASP